MKKKSDKISHILAAALFVIMGAICGFFGGAYIGKIGAESDNMGSLIFSILAIVFILYLAMFIQIIVHEAGHLVFGLLSGYDFMSFRIGSLMIVKSKEGLKVKKFKLMGTGGQCLMAPPDMVEGKIPFVMYNLGGVLFNLIFSGISVGLFLLTRDIKILSILFSMMAIIGVFFALMNGIPMSMGAVDNDGRNALNLGKNEEGMKCFWIQMKINEFITKGIRLKDMPSNLFEMPSEEGMKNPICSTIGVFACNRAMDMHEFDKAEKLSKELRENADLLMIYKNMLLVDEVYCGLINGNKEAAAELVKDKGFIKFCKAMTSNPSVIRMQYVYELIANGNKDAADNKLKQFEKVAKSYPHECEIESERELIAYAKEISETVISN